ncbi:AAA family ATPase [Streptomyces sp. NPDC002476]|uniref:AAA family ATPase n=1 Tax=Streptomyces sp. NPDC002476 TaxID=3364648 RepID=UPI0036C01D74
MGGNQTQSPIGPGELEDGKSSEARARRELLLSAQVDIAFEEITCFIGPTGVGKSTVLRALDWFFNGERSVSLSTCSPRPP